MRGVVIAAALVVGAGVRVAAAEPLADAVARHGDAELAALRAQLSASIDPAAIGAAGLGDIAIRCALGAAYLAHGDLPRASIELLDCDDAKLPDELAIAVARALHELPKRLRDSELAALAVDTRPPGMLARLDDLPDARFLTPATVWVPAGKHVVEATFAAGNQQALTNTVVTEAHSHALILLDAGPVAPAAKPGAVDFRDEEAGEARVAPPPDVKHGSLLPKKYQQRDEAAGTLEDPFDPHPRTNSLRDQGALRRPRRFRPFSIRANAGVFSDGAAGIEFGFGLAATAMLPTDSALDWSIGGLLWVARAEWTRRTGGTTADVFDTFGVAIGPMVTVIRVPDLDLRLGLAVRGELRDSGMLAGAAINSWGIGGDFEIEAALHAIPIVIGVRGRQAFTELADGIRDNAAIVDVGYEW